MGTAKSIVNPADLVDRVAKRAAKRFRPDVIRIRYSIGEDWFGDPSIFFRILLSSGASRFENLGKVMDPIRTWIKDALSDLDHIVYFDVRSEEEQEELKDPQWD